MARTRSGSRGSMLLPRSRDRDELRWLDVPIRRPTAVANVEGAARFGGFATQGEKTRENRGTETKIGPETVKPISFELGGRPGAQTINVLPGLTAKLAVARGGELHAAKALRTLRLILERTLIRSVADALNATTACEEQVNLRKSAKAKVMLAGRTAPM